MAGGVGVVERILAEVESLEAWAGVKGGQAAAQTILVQLERAQVSEAFEGEHVAHKAKVG